MSDSRAGGVGLLLSLLQLTLCAFVAGLAFGDNRSCRLLLPGLLLFHASGVVLCSPRKLAHAF